MHIVEVMVLIKSSLLFFGVCNLFLAINSQEVLINIEQDGVVLQVTNENNKLLLSITQDEQVKLSGLLGEEFIINTIDPCMDSENCLTINADSTLQINAVPDFGFSVDWFNTDTSVIFKDCFLLNTGETNWFGGPERWTQEWPVEKLIIREEACTTRVIENAAVTEPYWLNSKGVYIFLDEKNPLFIDQNNQRNDQVCFYSEDTFPYASRDRMILQYAIGVKPNAREAHMNAVENFLGKPTGHPNRQMIERPIWSTWARYKKDVNDQVLREFAQEILDYGFSDGQFEIDDDWEICYGALAFNQEKFSDITATVSFLKENNFRVTLWVHPFVNKDCSEYLQIGTENGYFAKSVNGGDDTTWWNSALFDAKHIDFTKPEAKQWFTSRLQLLQENHGIDSFKFDAGETAWAPQILNITGDVELIPNLLTSEYVRTCAEFGDLSEVRSAWKTQDLPVFVRMLDKDSRWGNNNGIATLITTLLQLNLNGYSMVLPDMIGGNGYGNPPNAELFVRWLQANTFMPSLQFSYVPWDFLDADFDVVEISKKFVNLHQNYTDLIINAMEEAILSGTPVNPPIWWLDPTDTEALKVDDEFLLGEGILVAPIIEKGAISRNIYLPRIEGVWTDGNQNDITYEGGTWLYDYSAPIDTLPYFLNL